MDAITLAAVARELRETLVSGRIQAVIRPSAEAVALEIFGQGKRQWLLLDAHPRYARVHRLRERARRGTDEDSPLLLLLRKYLRGARVEDVFQPAWERVLHLRCLHPRLGPTTLVGEIMGRRSNILLLDAEGTILEAQRRAGPAQNPHRVVLPGKPYQPPPPQRNKTPIDLVTAPEIERWLNRTPAREPLWRLLVSQIAGLSPLLARELVYRATGDVHADVAHPNVSTGSLLDVITWVRSLPTEGGWAPTVAFSDEDVPAAFAPYELTHLDRFEHYSTISEAACAYYVAVIGADSYAGRRRQVRQMLEEARKKLLARRASLGEQAVGEEDVARLRAQGEWILAYAWKVKPGDRELVADTGEGLLRIPLDPTLTASENAQAYFARYQKAKRAAARVPELLAEVDRDLAYLDQLQADLALADNAPQIEELREALLATGLVARPGGKRKSPAPRSRPLQLRTPEGFTVWIGRNAVQNEEVTWRLAQPEDIWLHTERVPGSHVVIRTGGREVPRQVLEQAAAWAAYYSQARQDTSTSVMYTQRRHLRRLKGGRPGQVRVLQKHSLVVAPQKPPVSLERRSSA
ncbi:MAG: fibronectin/fibrinogen-binding protein [Caldilineae bacterium]|nr:MAG: fibronectin/fibrinogen-binding protein [Caldilineae bacterium]